jgi:hypothetical protein
VAAVIVAARGDAAARAALVDLDAAVAAAPVAIDPGPEERGILTDRLRRARVAVEAPASGAFDPLAGALEWASALFAAGLFFEVHEVLEPVWRDLAGDDRVFVQGLIQHAVGFHHLLHDNPAGAASQLAAARAKLAGCGPRRAGVEVAALLAATEPWEARAAAGSGWSDALPLPRY